MPKSKLTAVLSLLFVFLSGAILGALAQRAYVQSHPVVAATAQKRPAPGEFRNRYITETRDRLKLSEAQMSQLTKILGDVDEEMRQVQAKRRAEDQASPLGIQRRSEDQAIQARLVSRVDEMLQPDQRVLYKQLRDEREKNRKQRDQQKGDMSGRGPGGPGGSGGPPPEGRQ
jgi:hypothetical protein